MKRRAIIEEQQKDLTDEERAKDLLEKQTKRIDDSIKDIEKKGLSKVGRIHEVARQAKGKGKGAGQPMAIKDPNTGKLVVDKEEIKKTTVQYCKQVLAKNDPDNDFKMMAKMKESFQNSKRITSVIMTFWSRHRKNSKMLFSIYAKGSLTMKHYRKNSEIQLYIKFGRELESSAPLRGASF